jgi:broad specificity phosphatase PhoE
MGSKIIKTVYFVRHGKTQLNEERRRQHAGSGLSTEGKVQAEFLKQRFIDVPFDKIITSDMDRAVQTAEAISGVMVDKIEHSALFRETKRPSEVVGKSYNDPESQRIFNEMVAHEDDPQWHYSDEENLHDVCNRARNALALIDKLPEQRIVIVSHTEFIIAIFVAMVFTDIKSATRAFTDMRYIMQLNNTGISIFEFADIDGFARWRLRTWNDLAHLGD